MFREVTNFISDLYLISDPKAKYVGHLEKAKAVIGEEPVNVREMLNIVSKNQYTTVIDLLKLPEVYQMMLYRMENEDILGELPSYIRNIALAVPNLKLKIKELQIQRRKEDIEKDF